MSNQIEEFIAHARGKGMDHATIRMLLLSAGWKEKEIAQALSAQGLDMEVPTPPDIGGAREAFLHLLSFAALYTLIISLVILFFQYIDRAFPDAAVESFKASQNFSGIRRSMAAIIVSFPLLLWMSRLIHRDIASHPQKAWSGIRRWLTYLTLFVAATTLMVDVITLVFSLLEGELTARFLLKVLTVFLLAGGTFTYYFLSLKSSVNNKKFLTLASIVVLFAIVWGVVIVGSPASGRDRKFDDRRTEDLRSLQSEIYNITYGIKSERPYPGDIAKRTPNRPVPKDLEEVRDLAIYQLPNINDPETGEQYVYRTLSDTSYELCAVFSYPREERYDIFWNHGEGRACFAFDVQNRQ